MKLSLRHVAIATVLFGAISSPAHAGEPTKQAPSAPASDLADLLAKGKAALVAEQRSKLAEAVANAPQRLLASERAASNGEGERIAVDAAIAAALADAGLAAGGKGKSKLVQVYTALATMQLAFDLRDALRDRVGYQLAIKAVRACKGEAACLDAIKPTAEMPAESVAVARKAKDLEDEERLLPFEIQDLSASASRVKTSDKQQKAVLDFLKG
jgi:hypothetical protein